MRIDYHVVRVPNQWHVQNARGLTLAKHRDLEQAVADAEFRAESSKARGIAARVTIHHPGKTPEVIDFPAKDST